MLRILFLFIILTGTLFSSNTLNHKNVTQDFIMEYYYDDSSSLKIKDILNVKFEKKISSQFTLGFLTGNSWLKIELHNKENKDEEFILSLTEPFYKNVNFFKYEDGNWIEEKSGFEIPLEKREIEYQNSSFYINIKANQIKTYYLQLSTGFPNLGEIKIYTKKDFLQNNKKHLMLYMFYFGSMFIIFIIMLFLYMVLKELVYGYYALYVLFTSIFICAQSGVYLDTILFDYTNLLYVSSPIVMIFLILFSSEYLKIKSYAPIISKLFYLLIIILIILAILIKIDIEQWYKYVTHIATFTFLLLCYTSILVWLRGSKQAKYYIIIISVYAAIMAIFTSMVNTWLPNNDFTRYSFIFATFTEVLFFSLVLANRFNIMQEETIKTQEELISFQTKNTLELEMKVEQRTKDINLLLKEVYHRVKNNFQVIISLLWLESEKLSENDKRKNVFQELGNRIKAMSMVHQHLYNSDTLSSIDSKDFILEIINESKKIFQQNTLNITEKINDLKLSMDQAIVLGVVINEVINNSIKHHPNINNCIISITLDSENGQITLNIDDNGNGFQYNSDVKYNGIGLNMIEQFSKKLPNSSYKFTVDKGTKFQLKFDII